MDEKNRLMEMLRSVPIADKTYSEYIEALASRLFSEGIIAPPCGVGQTLFVISRYYTGKYEIYECKVRSITIYEKNTFISLLAKGVLTFGVNVGEMNKTVFLTRAEAETAFERSAE